MQRGRARKGEGEYGYGLGEKGGDSAKGECDWWCFARRKSNVGGVGGKIGEFGIFEICIIDLPYGYRGGCNKMVGLAFCGNL